jgi:hypothetical protein
MVDDLQARADARLEEALKVRGARDPREFYRTRLRELREADRGAYDEAVRHYRERLLPAIADDEADPLVAWTAYGQRLAELSAPGRTVCLDETGRSRVYAAPPDTGALILHLPRDRKLRALVVGIPAELSPAQRAAYDWLVGGRKKLREG